MLFDTIVSEAAVVPRFDVFADFNGCPDVVVDVLCWLSTLSCKLENDCGQHYCA